MSVYVTIGLSRNGRRVLGVFPPYTRRAVADRVPGAQAYWEDKGKPTETFIGWTYPLSMETCWAFRKGFGSDLQVRPDLAAWAREELKKRSDLEAFRDEDAATAAARLDRVRELTPDLFMAISSRPYQLAGSAFQLRGNATLLGDEPGLGKTLQTIAALVQHGARDILVACPRTAVRTVWEREVKRWAPHITTYVGQGSLQEREGAFLAYQWHREAIPEDPCIMIVNNIWSIAARKTEVCPEAPGKDPELCPDQFSGHKSHRHTYEHTPNVPWLFERKWDAIVMDESHKALASTKNIQSKGISQARFGVVKLRGQLREGGILLALSGTPARSRLERFWGTLNWLDPHQFGSFWRWAETHFEVSTNGYGRTIGTENEHGRQVAVPKDEAAWRAMIAPYYLARSKAVVAADLPPIEYAGSLPPGSPGGMKMVWLDMDPKQAKCYQRMAALAEADVDGGKILATGVLAEITRLRQFANAYGHLGGDHSMQPQMPSAKADWILQFLQELEGTDRKVVIASSFTQMVNLVAGMISADKDITSEVLTLTGGTPDRARSELVQRFQDPEDPCRVVVLNSAAGGEAITLDRADDLVFVDMPWTGDEAEQVEARIHRVSRIHQVTVHRLASVGTIDEYMASLNDEQRALIRSAKPQSLKLLEEALKS